MYSFVTVSVVAQSGSGFLSIRARLELLLRKDLEERFTRGEVDGLLTTKLRAVERHRLLLTVKYKRFVRK